MAAGVAVQLLRNNIVSVFHAAAGALLIAAVTVLPTSRAQQRFFYSRSQDGHVIPSPRQSAQVPATLELLSSDEGVDFKNYLQNVYRSVMRNLVVDLPTGNDEKEQVIAVRVRVQRDGSLPPQGAVVIVTRSGTKSLKAAAQQAVRSAAPFGHVPDGFKGSSVDLLFKFYFKGSPSAPKQEPKVVPAIT